MKKIPKELTPKLLGLVLDEDIIDIYEIGSNPNLINGEILYKIYGLGDLQIINADTLARKMKEWCRDSDLYLLSYLSQIGGVCKVYTEYNENVFESSIADSETEDIFICTEWVAKKKGLIDV